MQELAGSLFGFGFAELGKGMPREYGRLPATDSTLHGELFSFGHAALWQRTAACHGSRGVARHAILSGDRGWSNCRFAQYSLTAYKDRARRGGRGERLG